jgi:ABC-type proline/glycine betaine transport system permease subunit
MLGVNQCIMMSLSMVVIASLIGSRGLGTNIIRSITRVTMSEGIEAGVAVVLIAIVLDRLSLGSFRGQKGVQWL